MRPDLKRTPGWTVSVHKRDDPAPVHPKYPLASKGGMQALENIINADIIWTALTKAQRELLLSCVAGMPVKPRADVLRRVVGHGLVDEQLQATDAGRFVVEWRLP